MIWRMRRSADTARQSADGLHNSGQDGPALSTLRATAARGALFVRCLVIVYLAGQMMIWHAFYTADPWRLAGPGVAAAWAGVMAFNLRRWPRWRCAALDCGVGVALALGAGWCMPPALQGEAQSWLYVFLASQVQVTAWFVPAVAAGPMALARSTAYWAGALLAPSGGLAAAASGTPAASAVFLLVVTAAGWGGFEVLRRRAILEDAALARADQEARAQYVVLSRGIEQREHERLLHDTVLNTLTVLARAADVDRREAVRRCRRDVALVEQALNGTRDRSGEGSAAGGVLAAGVLVGDILAVAREMRARGLLVHVEHADFAKTLSPAEARAQRGRTAAEDYWQPVPARVGAAIVQAVREALVNVASHAHTDEAWVGVSRPSPTQVRVSVRDAGVGFDPGQVGRARLGVRRSIIERLADCGGRATVHSVPGEGTVVTLTWDGAPGTPAVLAATRAGVP
jgi:signal transduction histidine kinase